MGTMTACRRPGRQRFSSAASDRRGGAERGAQAVYSPLAPAKNNLMQTPAIFLRHGESQWNVENRFTGWTDVDLTEVGRAEARAAGAYLAQHAYRFDRAFVSRLRRAEQTLYIVLEAIAQPGIPIERSWQLNERHYGALEGLNKQEFAERYGAAELERLRRGYDERPPPVDPSDPRHPVQKDTYRDVDPSLLPASESLADTRARVIAYWDTAIAPRIAQGEHVLLVAHGNTLRSLVMHLLGLSPDEIRSFEVPTGRPLQVGADDDGRVRTRFLY